MPQPHQSKKPNGNWVTDYYRLDIKTIEQDLKNQTGNIWQTQSEKRALDIFHQAAKRVPAYKDFLHQHKIRPEKIKSIKDFSQVPATDKKNYIFKYPLKMRAWDGKLNQGKIIASSSGTTGSSNFWPRGRGQELKAAVTHELLYKNFFEIDKYQTLLIIGFPMGVYVSGMATVLPSWLVAQKYPLTVMSVGNNKTETLKAIKNLHKLYQQIIFVGHPFFIKDVIETGKSAGVDWKKIKLRLMFCSEGFNEAWREHLMDEAGIKNKFGSTLSTYGSSEMLLMAFETPMSISLKQLAENKPSLFGRAHAPNVFQYNPLLRYVEGVNRELIFTSDSGLPLIRFNLHDSGKTLNFKQAATALDSGNKNWRANIKPWPLWQLPFLALWGRSDHTIIFYAANIYPEHIHAALHQKPFLRNLTGKFTLHKGYKKNMDEFLEINIELRPNVKKQNTMAKNIQQAVVEKLEGINMEYQFLRNHLEKDLVPRVKLHPYQHPAYFKPGLKPKYIS
ncbi:MAG: hypothetical protein P4L74_00330 [Candidatus Doudnabacteria bacterium]|nr:hypothetical protein [Candidatus Doudnabacteria bacterium]